jgi:hypothetical protein
LLEVFHREDVLAGVREAIARSAIGFDAVKHLVLCRIERRPRSGMIGRDRQAARAVARSPRSTDRNEERGTQ